MPIYGPLVTGSTTVTTDADGFIQGGSGLAHRFDAEPIVGDPVGVTRRLKISVKDQGVIKVITQADK